MKPPSFASGRNRAAAYGLTVGVLGGIYLYMLNTVPDLGMGYFPRPSEGGRFWKMQTYIFLSYVFLAAAMFFSTRILERVLRSRPGISLFGHVAWGAACMYLAGGAVLLFLVKPLFLHLFGKAWAASWPMLFMAGVSGAVIYACALMYRSDEARREAELRLQTDADELHAFLDRAELSMLEAQIEPHFLFNTLAHVKRQYRVDAGKADAMLLLLIGYLERAMPALRRTDWTIADELDLIRNYLEILEQRFGRRLRFSIAADEQSGGIRLPALVVATLVENAVRHGLAPKPEGGLVSVDAGIDHGCLHIEVRDDGVGFRQTSGTGLGLATVRARLRAAFGGRARFSIGPLDTAGVKASIQILLDDGG